MKAGMNAVKEKGKVRAPVIDYCALLRRVWEEDPITVSDVIGIINSMPKLYRGNRSLDEALSDGEFVLSEYGACSNKEENHADHKTRKNSEKSYRY